MACFALSWLLYYNCFLLVFAWKTFTTQLWGSVGHQHQHLFDWTEQRTFTHHVCLRCTCRTFLTGLLVVLALLMPGVRHEDINTKFWRQRRVPFGGRDVVLRSLCNIIQPTTAVHSHFSSGPRRTHLIPHGSPNPCSICLQTLHIARLDCMFQANF